MNFHDRYFSLSSSGNFFRAQATDNFLAQVLDAIEEYTKKQTTFPVTIAIRSGEKVFIKFRRPEESEESTESTIIAMVTAYDADEIAICFATDLYQGLKAGIITRSRGKLGELIFFELENQTHWAIGSPVGKIAAREIPEYIGKHAIEHFNNPEERARILEAQESLKIWLPDVQWDFPDPRKGKNL